MMYLLKQMNSNYAPKYVNDILHATSSGKTPANSRLKSLKNKINKIIKGSSQKKDVYEPWPDNTNPHTGERGGPTGPEPTRYKDWERKGRVSDF